MNDPEMIGMYTIKNKNESQTFISIDSLEKMMINTNIEPNSYKVELILSDQ